MPCTNKVSPWVSLWDETEIFISGTFGIENDKKIISEIDYCIGWVIEHLLTLVFCFYFTSRQNWWQHVTFEQLAIEEVTVINQVFVRIILSPFLFLSDGIVCMTIRVSVYVHIPNCENFIKKKVKTSKNRSEDRRGFSIRVFTIDCLEPFESA